METKTVALDLVPSSEELEMVIELTPAPR